MVVVDTDVLVDALEAESELARRRIAALIRSGELATTAVNLFELTAGPRMTIAQLERLHAALGGAQVLPVTRGAADIAAGVSRYLGRRGENIAAPDLLVAGVCIAHGFPLLTRNMRHFSRVPGLELTSLGE